MSHSGHRPGHGTGQCSRLIGENQTIGSALRATRSALEQAGVDAASMEARWLLEHLTELDHSGLISKADRCLSAVAQARLDELLTERLAGRPIGRVLGWSEFYGRRFNVSDATLDPRADTETLIDAVLERFAPMQEFRFADIGTGTGAIGISIACERPNASGILTDISADALKQASENVALHKVSDRLETLEGDLCAPLEGTFDLIASNPPYIRTAIIDALDVAVRDHDPPLALDGGADGLNVYRRLIGDAPKYIKSAGLLVVEIGFDQAQDLQRLLDVSRDLNFVTLVHDLGGKPRIVIAQRT